MELFANIGIDTIALTMSFPFYRPMEDFLSPEWKQLKQLRNGKLAVFVLKIPKDSKLPRLTLSQTPDYLWHLTAEVSFSAWLKGSNAILTNFVELKDFQKRLDEYVFLKSGFEFNSLKARVGRVDFAVYILVGRQNKTRLVRRLAFLESNFECHFIKAQTIYFQNKSMTYIITLYDKVAEMLKNQLIDTDFDIEKLHDYMKLEVRLRTARIKAFTEKLKLPDRSVESFLTPEVAKSVINDAKAILHLDLFLAENEDWIADVYSRMPPKEAFDTVGFIPSLRRFGSELFNGNSPKISKRTFQRHLKRCFDAGINPYE